MVAAVKQACIYHLDSDHGVEDILVGGEKIVLGWKNTFVNIVRDHLGNVADLFFSEIKENINQAN